MLIQLNANGSLELIETKRAGNADNETPKSDADFNILLNTVKAQRSINGRRSLIANAFSNTGNYFTSLQAVRLIQLVNSENFRLQLAKSSYHTIVDRNNFNQVYDLLNSQASENELVAFVNNYNEDSNLRTPMQDADFTTLYQSIQQEWSVATQMNSLVNTFNNTVNNFNTYQAAQLIQIVSAESNRLKLAKLSYRSITDPSNFKQVYDLLNSQSSRDELTAFVNNNTTDTNPKTAMPDENFKVLFQSIQQEWPVSAQMNSLTTAFTTPANYFNTYQASQLIQIVNGENNRLQLAKLAYRVITDPYNFNQVYALFNTQASKDELAAYINNNNTGINPKVPMTDDSFNRLYKSVQLQFFPGEKMNSLTNIFNNTGNFFTSAQAKQLIQLVSLEGNRLQLAKLSYRTITDRNNFSGVYDLLDSQASRNELDLYVKAYRD